MARIILTFVLLCAPVQPLRAGQDAAQPSSAAPLRFEKGTVEIGVIGGTSLPISLFRAQPDRSISMASFSIGRVMTGGSRGNNFEVMLDVTPVLQVRQSDTVGGWSVSPLFLRWNFPPAGRRSIRIFAEVGGGLLFTSEPVPIRTTTFNFIDQAGFGVRIAETAHRAWLIAELRHARTC